MTAKASSIYVFMILAFGFGLWVILSYGSLLEAPENLAGKWDLIPATSPPIETDLTGPMVIEQSGQFVNLRFGSGRRIQVKLIDTTDAPHGQPARTVQLRNSDWHMTVAG